MSKSKHPTFHDVQNLTRLVCECLELGCDPLLWRRHLAKGAIELIPDAVAILYEVNPPVLEIPSESGGAGGGGGEVFNPVFIDDGWLDERCRNSFYSYLQSSDVEENPVIGALQKHTGGIFETTAFEIEPEPSWWSRSVADYMREAWVDFNCRTHALVLPSGRLEVLTMHHHHGQQGWTPRGEALVSLLFRSLAPHLGAGLSSLGTPSILDLPPRVLSVLDGFFRGLSSKQVAAAAGISVHTVNEYAKVIHRHFKVQSRGELQALLAGVSHRHQINPQFGTTNNGSPSPLPPELGY